MSQFTLAFFGDVVGGVGRRAVAHSIPRLKSERGVSLFIANGENSRNGSGLSPDNYRELRRSGVHAVTLGDHCFKDRMIVPTLEDRLEPVARPANYADGAPGKRATILNADTGWTGPTVAIITVLGRVFMPVPTDNPFAAIDREISLLAAAGDPQTRSALVIVEVHGETTSEKQAMAYHCLERHSLSSGPRVVGVVGTHTHVQTSDARIIDHTLGAITDLGMSGPHRSVIGRDIKATLDSMVRQAPAPLDVASEDNRACGALITIDTVGRRAAAIEAFVIKVPD